MSPITQFKRWERAASKLPVPSQDGEWCMSNGFRFVVQLLREDNGRWTLGWELCDTKLEPIGMRFREIEIHG